MPKRQNPAARSAARAAYKQAADTSAPGEGSRFKALAASAKAGGASNPEAVAASVGRKKYGAAKFTKMDVAGRKH